MNVSGEANIYFGSDKQPELRFTPSGTAVTKFSLGFNQGKDKDRGFINAVAFNELAEHIVESFEHGDAVSVSEAKLSHSTYENREGIKITKLEVLVWALGASVKWNPVAPQRSVEFQPSKDAPAVTETPDESPF